MRRSLNTPRRNYFTRPKPLNDDIMNRLNDKLSTKEVTELSKFHIEYKKYYNENNTLTNIGGIFIFVGGIGLMLSIIPLTEMGSQWYRNKSSELEHQIKLREIEREWELSAKINDYKRKS